MNVAQTLPSTRPGRSRCPVCNGDTWNREDNLRRQFDLFTCRGCGLHRSSASLDPDNVGDEYGGLDLDSYFKSMRSIRMESGTRVLERVEEVSPKGKILDIGCGFGWFLDVAAERGWDTYGIEPSTVAVKHTERSGRHHIVHGTFPHDGFPGTEFDVVTMTDVLEHLSDPREILRQIRQVLRPDGILVVRVPNCRSLVYSAGLAALRFSFGHISTPAWRLWQFDFPYPHLWYFDPQTLGTLVRSCGYTTIYQATEPGVSLRAISRRLAYHSPTTSLPVRLATAVYAAGLFMCTLSAAITKRHDMCLHVARASQ